MSNDEESMYGEPVSEEEAERRRGMAAAFYASQTLPPLYRLSTMDADVSWGTAGAGAPPTSQSRFVFPADTPPGNRLEVHTLEFGDIEELAIVPWSSNFASPPPEAPAPAVTIPVTIGTMSHPGRVLGVVPAGWMVSIDASEGTFLILGPGDLPTSLSLIPAVIGMPAT